MKLIMPALLSLVFLTACQSTPQKSAQNPQGLSTEELLKSQLERISKLEREMDKKENDLRYQHLKELQTVQSQLKPAPVVNTNCKFLCF